MHRQIKHTYLILTPSIEPSSCEIARLFCFFECKKPHRGLCIVGETRISIVPPMRENSQKQIHYGLRKGNKIFVTFATINNN